MLFEGTDSPLWRSTATNPIICIAYLSGHPGSVQSREEGTCCRSKYEGKIATLTAINGGLQQEIDALHDQLEGAQEGTANEELQELQEEFRRRLATADRAIATLKVTFKQNQHSCLAHAQAACGVSAALCSFNCCSQPDGLALYRAFPA